jgi:hypothetical protein
MNTNELLEVAKTGLNMVQNESWRGRYEANVYDPSQNHYVQSCFADVQSRTLLVIAQELKRLNDLLEKKA